MPYIPNTLISSGGGGSGGLFSSYAMLRDEKAANTAGGASSAATWNTRTINTESFDPDGIVSLASNQFTLQAGTYYLDGWGAATDAVSIHRLRLQNITDATTDLLGSSEYGDNASGGYYAGRGTLRGRITIASAKTFEIQHYTQSAKNPAFGNATNQGTEVYLELTIYEES